MTREHFSGHSRIFAGDNINILQYFNAAQA